MLEHSEHRRPEIRPRSRLCRGLTLRIITLCFYLFLPSCVNAQIARDDWDHFFRQHKANGTIIVSDERAPAPIHYIYNESRARERFSPASTYKIPHALFALEAGLVRDEFEVFPWDGIKRSFTGHNQDQNLRSAMRTSALWVFAVFAQKLGEEKAQQFLRLTNYGNADPSTSKGDYWVDGNLKISASEQIAFLRNLYKNELPFRVEHQRLVKDIMIVEAQRDWILRAKTGWEGRYGWWVGWVEWPTGPVFFALNIDTPKRESDLYKREEITRAILRSIQALPPK